LDKVEKCIFLVKPESQYGIEGLFKPVIFELGKAQLQISTGQTNFVFVALMPPV
jgi:hypothetical protein